MAAQCQAGYPRGLIDNSGEIIPQASNLVHSLVEYGHDTDCAVVQQFPINIMTFVAAYKTAHAKLSWN